MFSCDEKFEPGHSCKRLFLIDTYSLEELYAAQWESQVDELSLDPEREISLRAVSGDWAPDTMQMLATIGGKLVIMLMDTTSTHIFLSKLVAKVLELLCESNKVVNIIVASSTPMVSRGLFKNVAVMIQGKKFPIDFYAPDINDYDVVISMQWLKKLGHVLWDFYDLQVPFK